MILRLALARADAHVLRPIHEHRYSVELRQLHPHPVDDGVGGQPAALGQRLQVNEQPPLVHRPAPARARRTNRPSKGRDGWISRDNLRRAILQLRHCAIRNIRRRLRLRHDEAGVVLGEKPFREIDVEVNGGRQTRREAEQRQRPVAQHMLQRARIRAGDRTQSALEYPVEPVLAFGLGLDEIGANHGCHRQRHRRRDQNGVDERPGKFLQQAADNACLKQHRNEGRHQRHADRNHGEPDLPRASQRGLQRRQSKLEIGVHVLDHHNRIVDDEADRHRQREQRNVVDRKPRRPHQRTGASQRQRHGNARGYRRRDAPQEHEHHHHDERNGDHQCHLHIVNARPQGLRPVRQNFDIEIGWHPALDLGDQRLHGIHGLEHVRVGLLGDNEQHGGLAIEGGLRARIARTGLDCRNIGQPHHCSVQRLEDQRPEIGCRLQLVVGGERRCRRRPIERAERLHRRGIHNCGANIVDREPHRRKPLGIDAHPDGWLIGTRDRHVGDAWNLRHARRNHAVSCVVNGGRR